jgi:protein-disulfide isomerase
MRIEAAIGLVLVGIVTAVAPVAAQTRRPDLDGYGYTKGSPSAPIVVIEFGDFGCSACGLFAGDTWPIVQREYIETGRVFWRYVPFSMGSFRHSNEAARAAECAGEQNGFFPLHDVLYRERKAWMASDRPQELFSGYVAKLGLNRRLFDDCYRTNRRGARTTANNRLARELTVRGTPTFFVNGQRAVGAIPIDVFREVMKRMGGH